MIGLLSELWFYDDDVDQWAAIRELDLRKAAWKRYLDAQPRILRLVENS